MGSQYVDVTFPACSQQQLQERYRAYQKSEAAEYGNQAYSGTMATCNGLRIEYDRLMSRSDAQQYIEENTCKWEACLAVRIHKLAGLEFWQTEGAKPFRARIDAAQAALYAFPNGVLARVRGLSSKTKGCRECGSSISVRHIRSVNCPVCSTQYLYTETDLKRLEALRAQLRKAQDKYDQVQAAYDQKRLNGEWEWYVGGWAAC